MAPSATRRRSSRTARRSSASADAADESHTQEIDPRPQPQPQDQTLVKPKSEHEDGAASLDDEQRLRNTIAETRTLLASIGAPPVTVTRSPSKDPLTAFDIDPEQLSLHTIRDQILSKSDRNKRLFLSADDPSPSKRRRSSLSQIMTDDALDIDWNTYKDWPEGLVHEEAHMLDYFRKLKFIYLEQETKMRFLADVQDDVENGTEATVYSPAEVAERERTAKVLKSQLAQAKSLVRSLRTEVDAAADQLIQPWQHLESDSRQAERLIKEIGDMELELAKIRASSQGKQPLTASEAEHVCDAQIQSMTALEDQTASVNRAIEATKKDLVGSLKTLDRLNAERSTAEKYAAEAKLGGGRDLETERVCATHSATLHLLRSILGITHVQAADSNTIKLVYRVPNATGVGRKRKPDDDYVHLTIAFDEVGGRVTSVDIQNPAGAHIELSEASTSRLRALKRANDVPLIVHEVLSAF